MEKAHVRFVQPVAKDQSRVVNKPLFPDEAPAIKFDSSIPIMTGAYRTPHDKAFIKDE